MREKIHSQFSKNLGMVEREEPRNPLEEPFNELLSFVRCFLPVSSSLISEISQMLTSREIKEKSDLIQKLKQENTVLLQEFLLNQLKKFKLNVEEIKNHKGHLIGVQKTFIAMKDKSSYLIGSWRRGLKLIQQNTEVYSEELIEDYQHIRDLVYIDHLDCYIMECNGPLYRKDIDENPPYLWMDISCGWGIGCSMRYSKINKRLIANKKVYKVCCINLENQEVEFELKNSVKGGIKGFRLFGTKEDNVVVINEYGHIILYYFNYEVKTSTILSSIQLDTIKERKERGHSISACTKNNFIIAHLTNEAKYLSSRMVVLEVKESSFIQKVCLDLLESKLPRVLALDCFGYHGENILWIGLTELGSKVKIYHFNILTEELEELQKEVEEQNFGTVYKIYRFKNELFFCGNKAKVVRLKMKLFDSVVHFDS